MLSALLVHGYGQGAQTNPGQAAPAEKRAEAWKELKLKKSRNLQPYRIGRIEKLFLWAEDKFTADGGGTGFTGFSPVGRGSPSVRESGTNTPSKSHR